MKKITFSLLFFLVFGLAQAQYQILIQRSNEALAFNNINEAFAQLQDEDTLYLPAMTFVPTNRALETDKKVHIIGAGYYKGPNDTIPVTIIDGTLTLLDGADGSSIEGVQMYDLRLGKDASTADIDHVSVKRSKFTGTVYLGYSGEVQYASFQECIFIGWVECNWATYLSFNNCFFSSQFRGSAGNTLINHSHIEGQCNGNSGLTIMNSFLEQGISGTNSGFVLYNCAFHETDPASYYANTTSQAINCIGPLAWDEVFEYCPVTIYTNGYNSHHDYRVKEGSLAKNAATDGTDIGLYGGSNPFKASRLPSNPRIESATVSSTTNEEGKITINMVVKIQDN